MEQLRARRDFRRASGTIHLEYDRPMKKSIGDNMIPKDWGFDRGLDLIKKAGFDGIELWLGDVPWFQMSTSDSEVRELRRKVENAGLRSEEHTSELQSQSNLVCRRLLE